MAKVLMVDDETDLEFLAKQKFRKQISDGAFELLFAQNGREALDLIQHDPEIAVVVSDVNMPEMDGLTLLDKLKDVSPFTKTIIVSAYGDTKTLRAAMNKGVYDFVTKPVDFNELGDVITRTLSQYHPPAPSLYQYQLLLEEAFPKFIKLNYPQEEKAVLWDAFFLNPKELVFLGVSILPTKIPFEIAVGTLHGILKSFLIKNGQFLIQNFVTTIAELQPLLKPIALIGHYHLEDHRFSYQTNDNFKVKVEALLSPSQEIILKEGESLTLESPSSASSLSLIRA